MRKRRPTTTSSDGTLSDYLRRAIAVHGGAVVRAPRRCLQPGELGPAMRRVVAEHRRTTHALSRDVVAVIEEHRLAMRLQPFAMIAGEITRQEVAAALEAFVAARAAVR